MEIFPVFFPESGNISETSSLQTVSTAIQSHLCSASLRDRGNDTRIQLLTSNTGVGCTPQTGLPHAKFQQNPDLSQTPVCLVRFVAFLHLSIAT